MEVSSYDIVKINDYIGLKLNVKKRKEKKHDILLMDNFYSKDIINSIKNKYTIYLIKEMSMFESGESTVFYTDPELSHFSINNFCANEIKKQFNNLKYCKDDNEDDEDDENTLDYENIFIQIKNKIEEVGASQSRLLIVLSKDFYEQKNIDDLEKIFKNHENIKITLLVTHDNDISMLSIPKIINVQTDDRAFFFLKSYDLSDRLIVTQGETFVGKKNILCTFPSVILFKKTKRIAWTLLKSLKNVEVIIDIDFENLTEYSPKDIFNCAYEFYIGLQFDESLKSKGTINDTINLINKMENFIDKYSNIENGYILKKIKELLPRNINHWKYSVSSNNELFNTLYNYSCKVNNNIYIDRIKYIYDSRILKNMNETTKIINEISETKKKYQSVIDDFDNNEKTIKSKDFFCSPISLTNWIDEMDEGSCLGILVKINTNIMTKIGFKNDANIIGITTTFFSVNDYIIMLNNHFENKNDDIYGNINDKNLITGRIVGDSNCILPIYINKYHWKMCKKFINISLGIAFTHSFVGYKKKHENIYYNLLINLISKLVHDRDCINNKWLQTYISIWRTCAEISFENKYNRGIVKYVNKFVNNKIKTNDNNFNILGQILSTGANIDDNIIIKTCNHMIRNTIDDDISNCDECTEFPKTSEELNLFFEHHNKVDIFGKKLLSFIVMYNIMHKLINEFGGFNKFIKHIDNNFGMLSQNYIDIIKKELKNTKNINNHQKKLIFVTNDL